MFKQIKFDQCTRNAFGERQGFITSRGNVLFVFETEQEFKDTFDDVLRSVCDNMMQGSTANYGFVVPASCGKSIKPRLNNRKLAMWTFSKSVNVHGDHVLFQ